MIFLQNFRQNSAWSSGTPINCHTRPGGKTYPIPKGIEGWAEEWYYIHLKAGQPAGPPNLLFTTIQVLGF